jgi:hypothetical protein
MEFFLRLLKERPMEVCQEEILEILPLFEATSGQWQQANAGCMYTAYLGILSANWQVSPYISVYTAYIPHFLNHHFTGALQSDLPSGSWQVDLALLDFESKLEVQEMSALWIGVIALFMDMTSHPHFI